MFFKNKLCLSLLFLCVVSISFAQKSDTTVSAGLRTNLLYDAILIPNIGAEIGIGADWSVALDAQCAWWGGPSHRRSWRFVGLDFTGRRYFPKPGRLLSGHHAGVYFQICTYDFKLGEKGYIGGKDYEKIFNHPTLGVGLEYGYTWRIREKLAIDASIGIGWSGGRNVEYITEQDHDVWVRTLNRNWFGPTRAAVSLIYYLPLK